MMKRFSVLLNGMLLLLVLAACEFEKRDPVDLTALPDPVSFSDHVLPVFEAKCATTDCHDGTKPPDLTADYAYSYLTGGQYLDLDMPEESNFYLKITGNGTMARFANDYDRALILKWIEEGAEDN